jgi:hypothetical protein
MTDHHKPTGRYTPDEIRKVRLEQFLGIWDVLIDRFPKDFEGADISLSTAARVVEHYLEDRVALTTRYRITGRIQRHKVAGLMAASIMRYRPVRKVRADFSVPDAFRGNEHFAILHGLAICSEGQSQSQINKWLKNKHFEIWFKDFAFHLTRNYTAEGLIMVFETFCLCHIPSSLADTAD